MNNTIYSVVDPSVPPSHIHIYRYDDSHQYHYIGEFA